MHFALTQDHIDTLKNEIARTGISIGRLFGFNRETIPRYMSENIAHSWVKGRTKTATQENWQWLISAYANLPDADQSSRRIPARHLRQLASQDDRDKVRAEFERTGIGGRGIYRLLSVKPDGLNEEDCIHAVSRPQSPRRESHVKAIFDAYAALPDSAYEPLPLHMREALNQEIERTGLSMESIVRAIGDLAPPDLNARMIYHWSADMVKTTKLDYVRLVLETLERMPDGTARKKPQRRTRKVRSASQPTISKDQFTLLWQLRRTSEISPHKLLSGRNDVPEGLTPTMVNGWLFKEAKSFSQAHFDYIVSAYREAIQRTGKHR